jgi:hypothetical protein
VTENISPIIYAHEMKLIPFMDAQSGAKIIETKA